ncbi:predicted protein [Naegleria gruberi]|uniref:Predicted protein n=1 Tax=Naegleria gruberi TaxID=5762 RepID=D2VI73_NAEGR|nr:uncharacterized protein NAEGRDRAFT_49754 [Naegleria gruberi]EFC43460.1 predicted protein [Naegleria gruberi]|eukprot:XP_002676204.1 predicted protein [Naegleria gruberi strain NEG-M]
MPFFEDFLTTPARSNNTNHQPKKKPTSTNNKQQQQNTSTTQMVDDVVEVNSDDSDAIVSSPSTATHKRRIPKVLNHTKPIVVIDDKDERSSSGAAAIVIEIDDMTKPKVKRERSDDVVFVSSKKVVVQSTLSEPSIVASYNNNGSNNSNNMNNMNNMNNSSSTLSNSTTTMGSTVAAMTQEKSQSNNSSINSGEKSNHSSNNLESNNSSQFSQVSTSANSAITTTVQTTPIGNNNSSNGVAVVGSPDVIAKLPKPKIEENSIIPSLQQANPIVNNQQQMGNVNADMRNNSNPSITSGNNQTSQQKDNLNQVTLKIPNNSTQSVRTVSLTSSNIPPQQQQNIAKPKETIPTVPTPPSPIFQPNQNPVNTRIPSPASNVTNPTNQINRPVNNNLTIEQLTQQTLITIENLKRRVEFSTVSCPVTRKIVTNPVLASDGIVYDRTFILSYISEHGSYSPIVKGCKITESSLINVDSIYAKAVLMIECRISKIIEILQSPDFLKLAPLIPENYLDLIKFALDLMAEGKLNTPSTPKFIEFLRKNKAKLLSHYSSKLKQQGRNDQSLYILMESYEMHKIGCHCDDIASVIVSLLTETKEQNVVNEEKKAELIRDLFTISNLSLPKLLTYFNIEKDFAIILDILSVMIKRNMCRYEAISTFIIQTITEINKGEIDNPFYKQILFFRDQLVICRKEME